MVGAVEARTQRGLKATAGSLQFGTHSLASDHFGSEVDEPSWGKLARVGVPEM